MTEYRRHQIASKVEHTFLKPEGTSFDINNTITEAHDLGVLGVCLSPSALPLSQPLTTLLLVSVVGFPSGQHPPEIKAAEAAYAVHHGAKEIDMVINLSHALVGNFDAVAEEVSRVKAACGSASLKVIIESAALLALATNGKTAVRETARASERGGAEFVKTSTGFHSSGGASVEAVSVMSHAVSSRVQIKASGGIRTGDQARALLEAGAHRLGLSGSRSVLNDFPI